MPVLNVHPNSQNLPIPTSQQGLALLDTGASISGIHEPVAQALNLQSIGPVTLGGVAGGHQHNLYQIKASFPGSPLPDRELGVAGVNLEGQGKFFSLVWISSVNAS